MKRGFTLAEVLITLGIIGVIAAMTLPSLIQDHRNKVVATRLRKFYSVSNQAIRRAEVDYGEMQYWIQSSQWTEYIYESDVAYDKDGKPVKGDTPAMKFFNKYFTPYMNVTEVKLLPAGNFIAYFADGTALEQDPTHTNKFNHFRFYVGNPQRCGMKWQMYGADGSLGKCSFDFLFSTQNYYENQRYKGFEPNYYHTPLDADRAKLLHDCRNYKICAILIQHDGWEIKKDYPFKVWY